MSQLVEFVSSHPYLVVALLISAILIIKSEFDNRFSGISQLNTAEAVRLLNQDGAVAIDVREVAEYDSGHIKASKHMPLASLKDKVDELSKYKDKPILLYCRSGNRSYQACKILKKAGFEKAHNLSGGVMGWGSANLPLTQK